MPLNIIIVGAGIAGLSASIALRQAGHVVQIFEKSEFAAQVGAALIISPNGAKVLLRLGFSFEEAQAVPIVRWDVLRGDNLALMARNDLSAAEQEPGARVWAVHRVDLHAALVQLATREVGLGTPVRIQLGSEVVAVAPTAGSVTLRNGSQHIADLVIGADGLHSIARQSVLGEEAEASATGLSAFRFLIDTERLCASPALAATLAKKGSGATLFADVEKTDGERHIMWYACRGYDVRAARNGATALFFCGYLSDETAAVESKTLLEYILLEKFRMKASMVKNAMMEEFSHFAPELLEIIRESSHVKCWPLSSYKPLTKWFAGCALLIGDAAHPMLPFGGQGSNSALEDSGALGYLFEGIASASAVQRRLGLFQRARQARAARVQILSSVRAGQEGEVQTELRKHADPPGSDVPADFRQRVTHDYRYTNHHFSRMPISVNWITSFDVYKKCDEMLQDHRASTPVGGLGEPNS